MPWTLPGVLLLRGGRVVRTGVDLDTERLFGFAARREPEGAPREIERRRDLPVDPAFLRVGASVTHVRSATEGNRLQAY